MPLARFEDNLRRFNEAPDRGYRLSMSFGVAVLGNAATYDLSELVEEADRAMYRNKRSKKKHHSKKKAARG